MSLERKETTIVIGTSNSTIVGVVNVTKGEVREAFERRKVILVEQARELVTMHLPTSAGIAIRTQCVPIGLNSEPISINVVADSLYFPDENEDGFFRLKEQIKIFERNEMRIRAEKSGIVPAKPGMILS